MNNKNKKNAPADAKLSVKETPAKAVEVKVTKPEVIEQAPVQTAEVAKPKKKRKYHGPKKPQTQDAVIATVEVVIPKEKVVKTKTKPTIWQLIVKEWKEFWS
jgi:methyl coenzyme M reductase subunit C